VHNGGFARAIGCCTAGPSTLSGRSPGCMVIHDRLGSEMHYFAAECLWTAPAAWLPGDDDKGSPTGYGKREAAPPARQSAMGSQISSATSMTRSGPA
jgi:hypothetical protein